MRIAHFTDLHARWHLPGTPTVARRRARQMPELFAQALERVCGESIDLIAVTGDLLDVPGYILSGDDYYDYRRDLFEAEAEADYRLFRELLEATGVPYLVLPGNHDDMAVMTRLFGPANTSIDLAGHRVATFWDRDFEAHVPRRYDRERRHLLSLLADESGLPQVHLQHFMITPILNDGWPYSYWEGDHLRRLLADSGKVRLALSGHRHSGWEPVADGACTFVCGKAFCDFPHCYQVIEVDDHGVGFEPGELLALPREAGRPAVFLDRDGVLCEQPSWRTGPEELRPMPGAGRALRRLRDAGYVLVVISSQSAVGAGYLSREQVDAGFDKLARAFWHEAGGYWDAQYYSTGAGPWAVHPDHEPNPHGKPRPDYALQAAELFGLSLDGSYFVGDNLSDLQAGRAAGARPVLVRTGHGSETERRLGEQPELADTIVCDDLPAFVARLLGGPG